MGGTPGLTFGMWHRALWSVMYVLMRMLVVLAAIAISMMVAITVQNRMHVATSFDDEFARLGSAFWIAGATAIAVTVCTSRWGASQFLLGARVVQSCIALALATALTLIWLKR